MIPALLALSLAAAVAPAPPARPARACLQVSPAATTHYTPVDDHTIVVDSGASWWRLTTTPSSLLTDPQAYLINEIRGSSTLCDRLDFDLSVAINPGGFKTPLIVQSFESISAEEGRALRQAARR